MQKTTLWLLAMVLALYAQSQHRLIIQLTDRATNQPLEAASVVLVGTKSSSISNEKGIAVFQNIGDGKQVFEFRFIGYSTLFDTIVFPRSTDDTLKIEMEALDDALEDVVISSTRSSRTFSNTATRLEYIAGEELEEKANMKAGDIRMVLSESTGIQVQQTSATSANASIRIQGLDGRYTQVLKDGFPVFAGAASGLGLLQTPPLDLKQVEVIKGSASTLYGGGAIAGLVNLISKTPTTERDLRFHLNGSTGKGFDLNGFYSKRSGKIGTTIFAAHNRNWAYDPANINLTAIPKFERFVLNPNLFVYFNSKTNLNFGINTAIEKRIGGDLSRISGKGDSTHRFFEKNNTQRYSTKLAISHSISPSSRFNFKNSVTYFNRQITVPDYQFDGLQVATFSEANYSHSNKTTEWIGGLNLWTDNFTERRQSNFPLRSYKQLVAGAFVQNTWRASNWLHIESGLRSDYVVDYGLAVLPRVSALFKISTKLTSRVGAGFGYKTPTIFSEESERQQYQNVLPIDRANTVLERSVGGNVDFNYRTEIGEVSLSINQLFFYTKLNNPLLLRSQSGFNFGFENDGGHIDTRGAETNLKLGYEDLSLLVGYTLTDARLHSNGSSTQQLLTPKHRVNAVLMYEKENEWKLGLESYYFDRQQLSDEKRGRDYVLCGFMAEKLWETFSVYVNFENFLDIRQTKFDTIYTGSITNPVFRDIYAPVDGFLINGGVKIRL